MAKPVSERQICSAILADILNGKGSLGILSQNNQFPDTINMALVQELCYGVCRWYHRLHFFAQLLLTKPLRKKDYDIYCLILLGLYQLFYMRIPAHAAINETVNEADLSGKVWAKGLINAVLREAQRQEQDLMAKAQKDYVAWYSHPAWLLDSLKKDWGVQYRDILDANNARAPMTLRVNLNKISREVYLGQLETAGIKAIKGQLAATAVVLENPCNVAMLPGFGEGFVSVQDEASQLIVGLLPLKPGLRVLDACAAPGGKTCALLEAEPALAILAIDKEERRLPRIQENLTRLALHAEVRCLDITQAHPLPPGAFDVILLDVPCSATGVIRRHPDIKLLRTVAEVDDLTRRQAALLIAAWHLLAPGGFLLYSTCSTLKVENCDRIAAFLLEHPEAQIAPLQLPGQQLCSPGFQLLPVQGQNDGFYYALLQK